RGTVYAKAAQVSLTGNGTLPAAVVAGTMSLNGNGGSFQLADGASSDYAASTSDWITSGALTLDVEDDGANGPSADELARLDDAVTYLNDALGSFGVQLSWAAPGAAADVRIHFTTSTPEGGAADGVIGFTTADNDVYFVTGWGYYARVDPTAIAAGQYDFLTLATHELAHTVGLGESVDPASVMYEYLAPGTARRTFTGGNLARINTDADRYMKVDEPGARPATDGVAQPSLWVDRLTPAWGSELTGGDSRRRDLVAARDGREVLVGGAGSDVVLGDPGRNLLVGDFRRDRDAADGAADVGLLDQFFALLDRADDPARVGR
ncbi:MAG TPA: hypothetical protein VFW33_07400, partial [Gemmataceae bacterium]|nr:hypothetical protein [Gemmataceae bacterium]